MRNKLTKTEFHTLESMIIYFENHNQKIWANELLEIVDKLKGHKE